MEKKPKVGFEIEFFTVDENGKLVNKADTLINTSKASMGNEARQEAATCMVEIGSKPDTSVAGASSNFLHTIECLMTLAEEENLLLLPLGIHPSRARPVMRSSIWYSAQQLLLGRNEFNKAGKVAGFHVHYELPARIVPRKTHMIQTIKRSVSKDVFLNQYNLLIAMDPALITFCQSTPFWYGVHYGKDCRVIAYRDFQVQVADRSLHGLYYYLPLFGSLPHYEFTLEDLRLMSDERKSEWIRLLQKKRFKHITDIMAAPTLKFMWGPVRVNKIGTIEYRGLDMNFPSIIFGLSELIKLAMETVEKNGFRMVPSDIGITEPFAVEDDSVYLPPRSRLQHLQFQSAVKGFESNVIENHCKRLFSFITKFSPSNNTKLLNPIKKILTRKKTVSDEILELTSKNGYDAGEPIPDHFLDYVALYHAHLLKKDLAEFKRLLKPSIEPYKENTF